jgi:hypothetical protein
MTSSRCASILGCFRHKKSFHPCKSVEFVMFESDSRLEGINKSASSGSGLKSIVIPSPVIVLGIKRVSISAKNLNQ